MDGTNPWKLLALVVFFFLPIFVISLAYSAIVIKLWFHRTPGDTEYELSMRCTSLRLHVKKRVS